MFKFRPGDLAVVNDTATIKSRIGAVIKIHSILVNGDYWIEILECKGEPSAVGVTGPLRTHKASPLVLTNKQAISMLKK